MTLDEAIEHCEEVAARMACDCKTKQCGAEHLQLAEWLKELRSYRVEKQSMAKFIGIFNNTDLLEMAREPSQPIYLHEQKTQSHGMQCDLPLPARAE